MMRHVSKWLAVIGAVAVMAGCATQQPVAVTTIADRPPVSIPVPTPTNLQNMKYQLVTAQTFGTFQSQLQANPTAQFYVLDRSNMEIMISNVQELRRYILEQKKTIDYLADVLKSQQSGTPQAVATPATTDKKAK
jgi:hypothetical protein